MLARNFRLEADSAIVFYGTCFRTSSAVPKIASRWQVIIFAAHPV